MSDRRASVSRVERAISDTRGLRDVRPTIARATASAFLSLLLLGLLDYPRGALGVWLGLVTLVAGFALVLVLEFGTNLLLADGRNAQDELRRLQPEVEKLRNNQADVEALRKQGEEQQAAYIEQNESTRRMLARVEAHDAAHTEVMWGVYWEQNAGQQVSPAAIEARLENAMKARGLDAPIPMG